MKKSEILKAVKENLSHTDLDFICLHLTDSTGDTEVLINWIVAQLQNEYTYGDWIRRYHPEVRMQGYPDYQQGRHQWLDHMIKVCEEMGD
mgnify:CR=1 FL=1